MDVEDEVPKTWRTHFFKGATSMSGSTNDWSSCHSYFEACCYILRITAYHFNVLLLLVQYHSLHPEPAFAIPWSPHPIIPMDEKGPPRERWHRQNLFGAHFQTSKIWISYLHITWWYFRIDMDVSDISIIWSLSEVQIYLISSAGST